MAQDDRILLAHGSGVKLAHDLVERYIIQAFHNPLLNNLDDPAIFDARGRQASTTDSYVVSPSFQIIVVTC